MPRFSLLNPPLPSWVASLGLALLRVLFGGLLWQTGLGKLQHLGPTSEFFTTLGLPFPGLTALGVGALECGGGVLFALGAATRPVAFLLAATLFGALVTAHRTEVSEGFAVLVTTAPFPYLLALLTVFVAGPGRFALDAVWPKRSRGQ